MIKLEISSNKESKLVDIWLSQEDQVNQDVQNRLRELYHRYKGENYTVAVFCSGQQDLTEETSALLRYNRRRSVEQIVQGEKK